MFSDIGEQEYVFGLLDEWANYQLDYDLVYLTGSKSQVIIQITKLIEAVQKLENETIKKNKNLKVGFSYQSELLNKLSNELVSANSPVKLLKNLSSIKLLLLQAMIISIEIKYDKLVLINTEIKPDADIGKSRKKQIIEWSIKGSESRKKYDDEIKKKWLDEAKKLQDTNPSLSKRAIAIILSKNDKENASMETIRKFIAKNLG